MLLDPKDDEEYVRMLAWAICLVTLLVAGIIFAIVSGHCKG